MAEIKKRLYLRRTIDRHYSHFTIQVEDFNILNFPDKLMDVVIFGSYINTNNPKIHDLDIGVRFEKHPELYDDYKKRMSKKQLAKYVNKSFLEQLYIPYLEEIRFLKAGYGTISIHDIQDDADAVFKDKHLYIMKDEEIIDEALSAPIELSMRRKTL